MQSIFVASVACNPKICLYKNFVNIGCITNIYRCLGLLILFLNYSNEVGIPLTLQILAPGEPACMLVPWIVGWLPVLQPPIAIKTFDVVLWSCKRYPYFELWQKARC